MKQFTTKVNDSVSEIWSWIFQSYGGWVYDDSNQTDLPESTTNLVAGQTNYALASDMLTVNRVEVTDGPGGNVRRLIPLPQEQIEGAGIASFSPQLMGRPQYYRLENGMIQILPASPQNVTDGLAVYFERDSVQFVSTDTTKTPGFASPFHRLAWIGAAIRWYKVKQPQSAALKELKEDYDKGQSDCREYYIQRWRDYRARLSTPFETWN